MNDLPQIDRQKEFSGTRDVRKGFELDVEALQAYMQENVDGFKGPITLQQFKGGQSNPTYLVITPEKKYVLRRKPLGKLLKSAHAVDREYRVITALGQTNVPVAKTYALCEDDSVIGSWFYIMDYVEGRIFWTYDNTPLKERKAIFDAMNDTIAKLHMVDYEAIGLGSYGKQGNFFSRQISRWTGQYSNSVEEKNAPMEELIAYLESSTPENDDVSIVHGDFRIDNMIFHPTDTKVLAVLDWELSTLGHPLADMAYHCLPWIMPAETKGGVSGLGGIDLDKYNVYGMEEYIKKYFDRTGKSGIENWNYYMAFSCFRLAGICFGIQGRVRDGTASSKQAKATAAMAEPLAMMGLSQAKS